jgi:NADH:ubiquinone oxidoreductase subunit 5 (subunit L)/multisubunit Na+/H+ antiporter MnhA subunit
MDFSYTLLILVLPLAGFLVIGLLGGRMKGALPGWLGTTGLLITLIVVHVIYRRLGKK